MGAKLEYWHFPTTGMQTTAMAQCFYGSLKSNNCPWCLMPILKLCPTQPQHKFNVCRWVFQNTVQKQLGREAGCNTTFHPSSNLHCCILLTQKCTLNIFQSVLCVFSISIFVETPASSEQKLTSFRAGMFLLVSLLTCASVASAHVIEWFKSVALCYCMHLRLVLNDLYSNQDFNFYNEFTVTKFRNMHFFLLAFVSVSCTQVA